MGIDFKKLLVNPASKTSASNDRLDKAVNEVKEFLKELFEYNQNHSDKVAVTYGAIAGFLSAKTGRRYRAMGLMTWLGPRIGSKALQALITRIDGGIDLGVDPTILKWYNEIFPNSPDMIIREIPDNDIESEAEETPIDINNPDF